MCVASYTCTCVARPRLAWSGPQISPLDYWAANWLSLCLMGPKIYLARRDVAARFAFPSFVRSFAFDLLLWLEKFAFFSCHHLASKFSRPRPLLILLLLLTLILILCLSLGSRSRSHTQIGFADPWPNNSLGPSEREFIIFVLFIVIITKYLKHHSKTNTCHIA